MPVTDGVLPRHHEVLVVRRHLLGADVVVAQLQDLSPTERERVVLNSCRRTALS